MDFKLLRDKYTSDSALGELVGSNGVIFCSLERLFDGVPKIPPGTYDCVPFDSPHLGYRVFMLVDVPGHDHILIHIANTWQDLDGCIGIGLARFDDSIGHSKDAFNAFMKLQDGVTNFQLIVVG